MFQNILLTRRFIVLKHLYATFFKHARKRLFKNLFTLIN